MNPASSNSLSPYARSSAQADICRAYASTATLTTKQPSPPSSVGSAFRSVSLSRPSDGVPTQNMSDIGLEPAALKNEKGARLSRPSGERVDTNAIGRGVTAPVSSL